MRYTGRPDRGRVHIKKGINYTVCSVNDSDSLFDKQQVSEAETGDSIMYAIEGKLFQHARQWLPKSDSCN